MKIAVWGADTFVGSNICNYMLQYTKNDIFGIFVGPPPYRHMEGPLRSRTRFDWQITTSNHDAIDLRLQVECPDLVLVTTPVPEMLNNRFVTCYVGADPDQLGASRTFLTPEPFGPRQPRGEGIASIVYSDEPPADARKSVIYIKDLYDQLMAFVESGAKNGSAIGTETTTRELWSIPRLDKITGSSLEAAIVHTIGWYSSNKWFK
jgi:hypothetical protein